MTRQMLELLLVWIMTLIPEEASHSMDFDSERCARRAGT